MKLLAIAITHYREAQRLANCLKVMQFPGVPGRVVESFSVPAGMTTAVQGMDEEWAAKYLGAVLAEWDCTGQGNEDKVDLLQEILTSEISLEGGQRLTVSQLLKQTPQPDYTMALNRCGVKRYSSRKPPYNEYLFICQEAVRKHLLKGADFSSINLDQHLLRLTGAKRDRQRLGGDHPFHGIAIPMDAIAKIFGNTEDDASYGNDSDTEYAEVT